MSLQLDANKPQHVTEESKKMALSTKAKLAAMVAKAKAKAVNAITSDLAEGSVLLGDKGE